LLAADSLEDAGKGILSQPLNSLDPRQLFEDEVMFAPWRQLAVPKT